MKDFEIKVCVNGITLIDRKTIECMEDINELGSILKATRKRGYSYSHVWGKIVNAEEIFGPLVIRSGSAGSELTEKGQRFIDYYRNIEREMSSGLKEVLL